MTRGFEHWCARGEENKNIIPFSLKTSNPCRWINTRNRCALRPVRLAPSTFQANQCRRFRQNLGLSQWQYRASNPVDGNKWTDRTSNDTQHHRRGVEPSRARPMAWSRCATRTGLVNFARAYMPGELSWIRDVVVHSSCWLAKAGLGCLGANGISPYAALTVLQCSFLKAILALELVEYCISWCAAIRFGPESMFDYYRSSRRRI